MALYIDSRRCGNTTRIVDELIQKLFTEGECHCYDHYHESPEIRVQLKKRIMRIIIDRLRREHNIEVGKNLGVDSNKFKLVYAP